MLELNAAIEINHGIRVSNLAYRVAEELGLAEHQCYEMAIAGMVHDVGKMEMFRYIYERKVETLQVEEMRYVRTHSALSYAVLNKLKYPPSVLSSILYHHENYDGSGYPANLEGEEIPLGARILRVCDVFAALTSDRPYRRAFDRDTAVELMIEEVKNFDMKIFLAFLRVIHQEDFDKILEMEPLKISFEEDIL